MVDGRFYTIDPTKWVFRVSPLVPHIRGFNVTKSEVEVISRHVASHYSNAMFSDAIVVLCLRKWQLKWMGRTIFCADLLIDDQVCTLRNSERRKHAFRLLR